MSKTKAKPEPETQPNTENEFVRTPLTLDDLKSRVAEGTTHKLKEGDEIKGLYMGTFSVETSFGESEQHMFKLEGGETVYYWSNWSFNNAIVNANLEPMTAVHIRRYANNVYVVDRL